jgi:tetratricopeptide (TPR) repeat protein
MLSNKKFSLEEACKSANYIFNLEEVIQTHPNATARTFGLSIIKTFSEENEKSLEYLEELIKGNPDVLLIRRRIAEFFIDFDEYEKAIFHLEKILELESKDLTAKVWLCLIYYKIGEIEKAKKTFESLREFVYSMSVKIKDWRED